MANFFDNKARAANAASSSSSKPKQNSGTAERAQPWVEKYRLVVDFVQGDLVVQEKVG